MQIRQSVSSCLFFVLIESIGRITRTEWYKLFRLFFSLNQIIVGDMENLCQCFQFQICDIVFVGLNLGNYIFIHIIVRQLELTGKIALGETMLASQCNQAQFFAPVCVLGLGMAYPFLQKAGLWFVSLFAPIFYYFTWKGCYSWL